MVMPSAVVAHHPSNRIEAGIGIAALFHEEDVVTEGPQADRPLDGPGEVAPERVPEGVCAEDDSRHQTPPVGRRSTPLTT